MFVVCSLAEIYLFQLHDTFRDDPIEAEFTVGTDSLGLFITVHDALQNGSHGGNADPCPHQHRVLCLEDLPGRRTVRAIDVALYGMENNVYTGKVAHMNLV